MLKVFSKYKEKIHYSWIFQYWFIIKIFIFSIRNVCVGEILFLYFFLNVKLFQNSNKIGWESVLYHNKFLWKSAYVWNFGNRSRFQILVI